MALTVEGLSAESPTVTEERKGPRVDAPEKALEGFLRATFSLIPPITILPILFIVFGLGEVSKVVLIIIKRLA